jgi:transposase
MRSQKVSAHQNGRPSPGKGHFSSPTTYLIDTIKISELPRYSDRSLLHQKYVVEGLSAKGLADLLGCSTTTVKARLREFGLTKGGSGRAVHREKLAYGKRIVGHQETTHKGELQVIETIKRMYVEEHLRPRSIASLLDTMKVPTKRRGKKWDHSVVIAILKREGIYKQSRKSPQKEGKHERN